MSYSCRVSLQCVCVCAFADGSCLKSSCHMFHMERVFLQCECACVSVDVSYWENSYHTSYNRTICPQNLSVFAWLVHHFGKTGHQKCPCRKVFAASLTDYTCASLYLQLQWMHGCTPHSWLLSGQNFCSCWWVGKIWHITLSKFPRWIPQIVKYRWNNFLIKWIFCHRWLYLIGLWSLFF